MAGRADRETPIDMKSFLAGETDIVKDKGRLVVKEKAKSEEPIEAEKPQKVEKMAKEEIDKTEKVEKGGIDNSNKMEEIKDQIADVQARIEVGGKGNNKNKLTKKLKDLREKIALLEAENKKNEEKDDYWAKRSKFQSDSVKESRNAVIEKKKARESAHKNTSETKLQDEAGETIIKTLEKEKTDWKKHLATLDEKTKESLECKENNSEREKVIRERIELNRQAAKNRISEIDKKLNSLNLKNMEKNRGEIIGEEENKNTYAYSELDKSEDAVIDYSVVNKAEKEEKNIKPVRISEKKRKEAEKEVMKELKKKRLLSPENQQKRAKEYEEILANQDTVTIEAQKKEIAELKEGLENTKNLESKLVAMEAALEAEAEKVKKDFEAKDVSKWEKFKKFWGSSKGKTLIACALVGGIYAGGALAMGATGGASAPLYFGVKALVAKMGGSLWLPYAHGSSSIIGGAAMGGAIHWLGEKIGAIKTDNEVKAAMEGFIKDIQKIKNPKGAQRPVKEVVAETPQKDDDSKIDVIEGSGSEGLSPEEKDEMRKIAEENKIDIISPTKKTVAEYEKEFVEAQLLYVEKTINKFQKGEISGKEILEFAKDIKRWQKDLGPAAVEPVIDKIYTYEAEIRGKMVDAMVEYARNQGMKPKDLKGLNYYFEWDHVGKTETYRWLTGGEPKIIVDGQELKEDDGNKIDIIEGSGGEELTPEDKEKMRKFAEENKIDIISPSAEAKNDGELIKKTEKIKKTVLETETNKEILSEVKKMENLVVGFKNGKTGGKELLEFVKSIEKRRKEFGDDETVKPLIDAIQKKTYSFDEKTRGQIVDAVVEYAKGKNMEPREVLDYATYFENLGQIEKRKIEIYKWLIGK